MALEMSLDRVKSFSSQYLSMTSSNHVGTEIDTFSVVFGRPISRSLIASHLPGVKSKRLGKRFADPVRLAPTSDSMNHHGPGDAGGLGDVGQRPSCILQKKRDHIAECIAAFCQIPEIVRIISCQHVDLVLLGRGGKMLSRLLVRPGLTGFIRVKQLHARHRAPGGLLDAEGKGGGGTAGALHKQCDGGL
jgi:hypothetical protein